MTLLVVFLLSGALGIVVWLLVPEHPPDTGASSQKIPNEPHVQPTLILRPGGPFEDLQRSLRITNIGPVHIYDIELRLRNSSVSISDAEHLIYPRNLPPQGRLSVNIPAVVGIRESQFLSITIRFRATIHGVDNNFNSEHNFTIPESLGRELEIDPSSFAESVGETSEGPLPEQVVRAFHNPEGTIMMVIPDELNGKPNHAYAMTPRRSFSFDPVAHTAWFGTVGESNKPKVISKKLISDKPHNAHLITLRWKDTDDSGSMFVDRDHESRSPPTK